MALKNTPSDGLSIDFKFKLDLNELGRPVAITVDATADEQEAVNSAIRTAIEASALIATFRRSSAWARGDGSPVDQA
jgi:hypothetical protein